jgi:hypothetical protein
MEWPKEHELNTRDAASGSSRQQSDSEKRTCST